MHLFSLYQLIDEHEKMITNELLIEAQLLHNIIRAVFYARLLS